MAIHTVEKIGGTSMTQFDRVLQNVILQDRSPKDMYQRIFVVSAYGGITDLLLEGKKTGLPGIYGLFAAGAPSWRQALEETRSKMKEINARMAPLGLDVTQADAFLNERLDGVLECLRSLQRLCSFGHFELTEYLLTVREMLSSVGEAHSAYNATEILKAQGVNAVLADLTGWGEKESLGFDETIRRAFADLDLARVLPIATGYAKCAEGIMETFDRGYSEITFSKIAVLTEAAEGIIHKEFHLSTGDPKLIGEERVRVIGATNYDVADQLADLGMEAIHPRASKSMESKGIAIRVKNTFEPQHDGTVISSDYRSPEPRVDMITGRKAMLGIEVVDPDMVGQSGFDYRLLALFAKHDISYVAKNTNANTITHYVPAGEKHVPALLADLSETFPSAAIRTCPVAMVCAIGSNMAVPGMLARSARALAEADINVLALCQCMRQVNMQFVVSEQDFEAAQVALHQALVEHPAAA